MRKTELARLEDATNYVLADKSDPFALQRAKAHMRNGVCGFNQQGQDAFYQAEPFQEERVLPDGTPYMTTVYRNRVRP